MENEVIDRVSIALRPNVYSAFRNLVNTVSNTLAEYVDNALQSYLDHKRQLQEIDSCYKLRVKIDIDCGAKELSIEDNAAGIDFYNYKRAFEPANIPTDDTGLNQFGMGLKTASVWLADNWSVTTKALNEQVERFIEFDLKKVTAEGREELVVRNTRKDLREHYTRIQLWNLSNNAPSSQQIDKIKRHLASIYRKYLRDGDVEIFVNGASLSAPQYAVLKAAFYKTPNEEPVLWKKEVRYQSVDGKFRAEGFFAILDRMQANANGLLLMRKGRVIVGGGDERFFPHPIFGQPGGFRYRRIFGELELDGFEVTFNKNGFRDEDNLNALMDAIRDELRQDALNLLAQAENYRQRAPEEYKKLSRELKRELDANSRDVDLSKRIRSAEENISNAQLMGQQETQINASPMVGSHQDSFQFKNDQYVLKVELVTDVNVNVLYSIRDGGRPGDDMLVAHQYICRINLAHPFFTRFDHIKKAKDFLPIVLIFKSLAMAEIMSDSKGVGDVSLLRILFNQYIGVDDSYGD